MSKNRGKLTRAKAEAIAVVNLSIASALCLISIWASLVSEVSLRVGIKIVYIPTPSFSKFVGECAWDHLQKDLTRFRPVTSTQCLKNQLPVRNVGGPLLLPLHHGECALPVPVPQQQETLTGNYLWFQVPVVITIVCVAAHDPAFRSVFSGGVQRRPRLRAKQRGSQAARQQGPSLFCNKKPKLTSFARRKAQLRRYAKIRSFIRLFLRSYKLHHVSNDHDDKNNQRSQCSHQHQQSTNCNHAGINEDGEVPILEKELLHLFRSLRRVFGGVRKTPGGPRGTRKRGGESNAQDAGKPKKRSSGASQPSDTGGEDKFPNSNDAPGGSGGHDSGSTSMPSAGNVPKTLCSLCDCKGRHFHGCGCGQDGTPSKKMKSVGKDQVDGYNKLLSRVKDHPMWDEARTLGATDENVLQVAEGDAICDRCYNHDTVKLGEYMSHFPRYWLTVKGKYKTPSTGIAKWLMETTAHQQAAAPEEGNVDSASPDQNTPDAAMPRGRHCRLCDCKAHHHMDCECGQTGTSSGSGLVERKRGQPLIDLSRALASIREHPKLKRCEQPVADLLFIYLQSGSDYISKTYFVGHKTWLGNFLEHLDFVLSGTQVAQDTQARLPSFLTKEPGETGRLTIRDDAACRFIACPFWGRCKGEITTHSTAVKTIADLWVEMKRKREDRDQRLQTHLKEYLFRDPGDIVPAGGESWEVDDFLSVLRRAGYSKSADDAMLLPSLSAIRQHKLRTEYVINLVYQSTSESRPIQQQQVQNYGWEFAESGKIKIKWYDPNDRDIVELKQRMEKISDVRGSTGRAAPSTRQTSGSGPSGRIGIAPRKPCSCGKGNRDRSSDCCTRATCSCSKEHLPCIAPDAHGKGGCHCHGGDRCRNVHRDGGTCAQCPLPPNQVSMADIVPDPTGGATITTPETTTNYEDSHEEDGRVGKEDPLTIDAFHRHLLQAEAQQEEEEKQEQEDSSDPNELGEEGDNDGDEDIEQYFYGE